MSVHIMVDLETLGVGTDASILSIGAVKFNGTQILERFHIGVDITANPQVPGVTIDPGTVVWWLNQVADDDGPWREYQALEKLHLSLALDGFATWMTNPDEMPFDGSMPGDVVLWGNGATFDNTILRNAFKVCGLHYPVKFYNDMCYRTVKNLLSDIKIERIGTHHSAVDDAESQAKHLQKLAVKLGDLAIVNQREKLAALARALDPVNLSLGPGAVLRSLESQGLTLYQKKMTRRPRAQPESTPMTPQLRLAIRAYYDAMPGIPLQKVAEAFNTNIGRVSEALK